MPANNATKASKQNVNNLGDQAFAVEASRVVPDGDHMGSVERSELVARGEEGFRYFDVHVKDAETGVVIKAGYAAARITPDTDLGRLCARFGADVSEGSQVRPVQVVAKGTPVAFTTETEKNKNGRFARVVLESLRPAN